MGLKDVGISIGDIARVGLLISKKVVTRSLADERAISPMMASELVGRIHPNRIKARIVDTIQETHTTKTLRLMTHGDPFPPFRAGQFVSVVLCVDGVCTSRPYTISSPPTRAGALDITVREMSNGFVSHYLCKKASVGEHIELSGPAGTFYHEPIVHTDSLVFLAGGCGVTPFMSMIRHAADTRAPLHMHLIYGNRIPTDIIFHQELIDLVARMKNLSMDIVISEPPEGYKGLNGLLDARVIKELVGKVEGKTFFICGPHAMYSLCVDALQRLGVPERQVRKELSGPLPDITLMAGWPEVLTGHEEYTVRIDGSPKSFTVKSGEPLLNSMERNGFVIDSLCRSGECGVCRTRLVKGEVFMPPSVSLRRTDALFGYIHPCMAYPTGDLTIRP